jgi:WD40 repeat protein
VGYVARFVARGPLAEGDLEAHFRNRPRFAVEGGLALYDNEDTGVTFSIRLDGGQGMNVEIDVPRPPCFAQEAAFVLEASAAELELELEHDSSNDLAVGYEAANSAAHQSLLDAHEEPIELSEKQLERAWRWNFGREGIQGAAGPDVHVPAVEVVLHPDTDRACLAAAWDGSSPALVPDVDIIVLSEASGSVTWIDAARVAPDLEALGVRSPRYRYPGEGGLRECGVRHYDATLGASLSGEPRGCEGLRRVAYRDARSRELVRLALGIEPSLRLKPPSDAARFPAECAGFVRTHAYELERVLGGYTWRSPWKLESIAHCEGRGLVAGVGAGGTVFFDVASGRRVRDTRGDVHAGASIAISADGSTVAIGDEGGNLRVFDVDLERSGPALELRAVYTASGDGSTAYALAVSSDGAVVVGVIGDDVVVLRDGEEASTFRAHGAAAVARDLSRVWLGDRLLDVTTEQTLLDLAAHSDAFRVPALSPDGSLLAFGTTSGELRIVRLADGGILAIVRRMTAKGAPNLARTIVFSPDGRSLVVGDSEGVEVRTAPGLELVKAFPTPTWDAVVSADTIFRIADDRIWAQPLEGHAPPVNDGPIHQLFHSARGPIAVASSVAGENGTGGRAVLWHLPSGQVLRATERVCPDRINLSPDGRYLMLATEEALTVLDVGTLAEVKVLQSLGTERFVRPLDLDASPDGEHVLVCLEDGTVRMISIRTGNDAWRRMLGVRCATFTPEGSFVVGGDASRLRLIDARTGDVEHELQLPDPRTDPEHVLLGDGDLVARVLVDTGVAIVDLVKETLVTAPWPTARDVLAASPDGHLVAFTSEEEHGIDLVLLESDSRREHDRISLASAGDVPVSAAFSPDGKRLLVGTSQGALLVFARRS